MRTSLLRRFITTLGLLTTLTAPLTALDSNESNLTLLDTESPAIRDLAVVAKDYDIDPITKEPTAELVYDKLNTRNKIGVFFSENTMDKVLGRDRLNLQLLKPWEEKSTWTRADFLHSSTGPMFFMNDGRYQALAVNDPAWYYPAETLTWYTRWGAPVDQFKAGLNNSNAKVQVYKRFEFPATLPFGSATYYELDRARVDASARKLVIVIHGWNPEPDTDPYTDGNWPALMKNLSQEIKGKASYAPGWDLYAYRWGRDAYTGPVLFEGKNADGGIGKGVENGTQAAEIGYQHGLVLGKLLWDRGIPLEKVHFIAHSAGTWVARSASLYLKAKYGSSLQQITLLDPYNPHRGWQEDGEKTDVDDSILSTELIEDGWEGKILPPFPTQNILPPFPTLNFAENIYSKDTFLVGTNEEYGQGFVNIEVGKSLFGAAPADNRYATLWDDHGGPINFYAYTVDPFDLSTSTESDRMKRNEFTKTAGWEHSLFMREYYQWLKDHPLPRLDFNLVLKTGYVAPLMPIFTPQDMGDGPMMASASIPEWSQVLVDVDSNAWVRLMLIPTSGGAAVLAGPARLAADGTFAITLGDGRVMSGSFDTGVTPPALTLALDGSPLGQPQSAAQGSVAQRGFDVNVNAAGNVVISAVLADGTTGMSVAKDAANTGWEGSGVGTLDANGNFVVSGADGLLVTGQMLENGSLVPQVAPPQVPEIHVQDAAGGGLISGASSQDCGSVGVGSTSGTLSLTIRNTGTVNLTNLGVMVEGEHSGDFSVSALGMNSLAPDGSVVLMVTFSPSAAGSRTATLRIASNDANENPYEITLTGKGFTATPLASGSAGADGLLAAGSENYFRVSVTEPGALIFWSEGGTNTIGTILSSGGMALAEDYDSGRQGNFRVSTAATTGDYFIRVKGVDAAVAGAYTLRSRLIPATAPVQISLMEKEGDDVTLGFTNVVGALYRIEHSGDLQNWLPVENDTGNGAERLLALPGYGSGTTGFFRVGLVADGFSPDVAKGIDQPGATITPDGAAAWFTQTSVAHDSVAAARSGQIFDGQSSSFSMIANGPATVSFWWKISSQTGDDLRFLVDGVQQQGAISGEVGWQQVSRTIGSGSHTLTWTYIKDAGGSGGADCGWVDKVLIDYPEITVEQPAGEELVDGGAKEFGSVGVGSAKILTFTVKNSGRGYLDGLAVTKNGTHAADFTVGYLAGTPVGPGGGSIAPGASATFTVTFTPSTIGARSAAIRIASNDADENPFDINLSGMGAVPFAEISIEQPAGSIVSDGGTKDFGSVPAVSSKLVTFTVKNTGNINLTGLGGSIDGANAMNFNFGYFSGTVPGPPPTYLPSIPPGGSATFTVAFSPYGLGPSNATLHITSNDADENPFDINLSGIGTTSAIFSYQIADGVVSITGYSGPEGDVVVPAVIEGLPVTRIGSYAFAFRPGLTKVTLPGTVTDLEGTPFIGCTALTEIAVDPANTSFSTLDGVLFDGDQTMLIQYPTGKAGGYVIPSTVSSLRDQAFEGCGGLTDVTIPASVTNLGGNPFGAPFIDCSGLMAITVDSGNANYSSSGGVLFNQNMTTLIRFPSGRVGTYSIPDGVASIGWQAFDGCAELTWLSFPTSVTVIGSNSLANCARLTGVVFLGNAPTFSSGYPMLFGLPSFFKFYYTPEGSGFTSPTWAGYPTVLQSATQEIEVTGPSGVLVDAAGSSDFTKVLLGTPSLKTFTILNTGLADLGGLAVSINGLNAGDFTVGSLGAVDLATGESTTFEVTFEAAALGVYLATISIASNDADESPFEINLLGNCSLPSAFDYQVFNGAIAITGYNGTDGVVVIPTTIDGLPVTSIGDGSFYGYAGLTDLTIPDSVTSIGSYAFGACTNLLSVTIPASVTSIGNGPFAGCTSLPMIMVDAANAAFVSVDGVLFNQTMSTLIQCPAGKDGSYVVPGSVTSIGKNAFGWCNGLTIITIPGSVTSVGENAFLKCDSLVSVVFLGDAPDADGSIFQQAPPGFLVFYAPGRTGFTSPIWLGFPAQSLSTTQELAVIGPAGSLTDAVGIVDFGNVDPGSNREKTFTILNAGLADLTDLAIAVDGTDSSIFTVGGLGATTLAAGGSTTFTVTLSPTGTGVHSATIHVASNDADENPFEIELVSNGLDPAFGVAAGIDLSGTAITYGGQADWFWQNTTTHDGIDATQSGDISESQSSTFTLFATGPGTVGFWWKVSSEATWDNLRFYIDGVEQSGRISGEVGWQQKFFTLGTGSHTLRWAYTKDEIYSSGSDCGWVDQVVLSATGTALQNWRQTHFGTNADSGDAANGADPDRDGLKNLVEFAFGLNPSQNSAHLVPKFQRSGDNLACTFIQPAGVTGVIYGAEWTSSLTSDSWQAVANTGVAPQHAFSIPINGSQKKFVRFKVMAP